MTLKFNKERDFYVINIKKEDFYSRSPSLTALVLRHISLWRGTLDILIKIRLRDYLAAYLQKNVDKDAEMR